MSSTDIEPYLDLLMLMTNENDEEDSEDESICQLSIPEDNFTQIQDAIEEELAQENEQLKLCPGLSELFRHPEFYADLIPDIPELSYEKNPFNSDAFFLDEIEDEESDEYYEGFYEPESFDNSEPEDDNEIEQALQYTSAEHYARQKMAEHGIITERSFSAEDVFGALEIKSFRMLDRDQIFEQDREYELNKYILGMKEQLKEARTEKNLTDTESIVERIVCERLFGDGAKGMIYDFTEKCSGPYDKNYEFIDNWNILSDLSCFLLSQRSAPAVRPNPDADIT